MSAVRPAPEPDPDAEAEVDLGHYGHLLVVRWWLLLAGLVVGAIIGYLTTVTGAQFYRAQTLVYMGQPLGAISTSPIQALNTNQAAAGAIISSESVLEEVARKTGMTTQHLRSGATAVAVPGSFTKPGQAPLINVEVKGSKPAKVEAAANALAVALVSRLSAATHSKISLLSIQRASDLRTIKATNQAISSSNITPTEKLILELRLAGSQTDLTQITLQLAQAKNIESPSIVTRASSVRTSVRSHRNATAIGALIGLIIGAIAALAWEPITRTLRREP
jgi:capsular polysaccharide biosynthesis protein